MLGANGSSKRRVVVTGLGLVTPLACGVEESWSRLVSGRSGAKPITTFRTDDLATKIACTVPVGDGTEATSFVVVLAAFTVNVFAGEELLVM